ncbi:glycosyltransferase [Paraburkholderia sp. SARCC-3016]|uniref:glycosyltransferase n=1 Tax=Paraburkholderia sp. SARCC-3016 TaxID=3058611 RepID=UPI0028089BB2|nr:glycosyltransferase [Paraburkholderia sp. SARCC-3016]MDQ7978076.1 glycosyltransferase [Paraburkholderia sp. SARCC-3016]
MGGVEELINQICSGAAKRGISSDVLTTSHDTTSVDFGDHVHHRVKLDVKIASTAFSMRAFSRFAALSKQADLIHYHFPWPFADLVHFATRSGKPSIVTYHSDIVRQRTLNEIYKPLRNRFLGSVDRIVATSPNYVATSDVLQRFRDKVEIIPIGLDKASYPEPSEERLKHWRARFPQPFFLFVGNLRYYKGLHILLEACRGTNFPVLIVGAGPVENVLRQQAGRLALGHVHFLGPVDDSDKIALLTLCHALTFPSHLRSEAFGISLLEGAMFSKPLVTAEIGTGTSYVNIDGETGFVVPACDSAALRNAMARLYNEPELAIRLGTNARMRFEKCFTAERMVDSYISLYRRLAR